jgi:zinc D-Ala-D-Ala dipeptidase
MKQYFWQIVLSIVVLCQVLTIGQIKATAAPQLTDILTLAPGIQLDIRYATVDNFLGQAVYPKAQCLLRSTVAQRLANVQQTLESQNLGLKVFDCYRPLSVQKRMWKIKPDANYVANPQNGSRHNRGAAVDVGLVDDQGQVLEMPSEFDDFSDKSDADYPHASKIALQNRRLLQQVMKQQGFKLLDTEWWHFDAPNWQRYKVLDIDF